MCRCSFLEEAWSGRRLPSLVAQTVNLFMRHLRLGRPIFAYQLTSYIIRTEFMLSYVHREDLHDRCASVSAAFCRECQILGRYL